MPLMQHWYSQNRSFSLLDKHIYNAFAKVACHVTTLIKTDPIKAVLAAKNSCLSHGCAHPSHQNPINRRFNKWWSSGGGPGT